MPIETPTQTPGTTPTPVVPAPAAPLTSPIPVAPAASAPVAPAKTGSSSMPVTILIVALVALLFGALGYFGGRYVADMLGVGTVEPPVRPAPMEPLVDDTQPDSDEAPAADQVLLMEDPIGSDAAIMSDEPLDLSPTESATPLPEETMPTEPTL